MNTLTLQARAHEGETLASICSRTAALHGADNAHNFWSLFGINFLRLCDGGANSKKAVERLLGPTFDLSMCLTVKKARGLEVQGHRFSNGFATVAQDRVCAFCLADDELNGSGRPGTRSFSRLNWIPTFLRVCPIHHTELSKLPSLKWQLGPDFAVRLKKVEGGLTELCKRAVPGKETELEHYALARFEGRSTGHQRWLDSLPLQASVHLCELVGRETTDPDRDWSSAKSEERAVAAEVGFARLEAGLDEFKRMLAGIAIRNHVPRRKACPFKTFGSFAAETVKLVEYPGYAELLAIMQQVATESLALGPPDAFLGSVATRRYHTVYTASQEYGLPCSSIQQVLERLGKLDKCSSWQKTLEGRERQLFEVSLIEHVVKIIQEGRIMSKAEKHYIAIPRPARKQGAHSTVHPAEYFMASAARTHLGVPPNALVGLVHERFLCEYFPKKSVAPSYSRRQILNFDSVYINEKDLLATARRMRIKLKGEFESCAFEIRIPKWRAGENFYSRADAIAVLNSRKT